MEGVSKSGSGRGNEELSSGKKGVGKERGNKNILCSMTCGGKQPEE